MPIGFILDRAKNFTRAFDPIIQILRPVSPLAWLPLGMVLFSGLKVMDASDHSVFGTSDAAALFTIAIGAMWPTVLNTAVGVRAVPQDYLNVAKVLQLTAFERVFQIILPVAVPFIFTGMRLSLGIAWLVIVAAEMLTGGLGIGFWIWDEYNNLNYSHIIIGIILIGVVGYILDTIMGLIADYFDYRKRGRV